MNCPASGNGLLRQRENEIFAEWRLRVEHGGGESVAAREMARALAGAEMLAEAQNAEVERLRKIEEAARGYIAASDQPFFSKGRVFWARQKLREVIAEAEEEQ